MFKFIVAIFIIVLLYLYIAFVKIKSEQIDYEFPEGFLIGTASAAYQIEGAWNISDKTVSVWDYFVHNHPKNVIDHSTGDIACDSYKKYKEDIDILKNLSIDHYRFSLSWSRILPKGHAGYISKSAINHYHKVLDGLEEKGIIPFLTIYHWDHPQVIEDSGGWLNDTMPFLYADYARVVFNEFAHRVKYFVTINEPTTFCVSGYVNGEGPPGLNMKDKGEYTCIHNMLKANALAYRIYDSEFRHKYDGKVGIVVQCKTPYSKNENDTISNEIAFEFECGWQAHAIFSAKGDYPEIMKQMVAERSKAQGFSESRLPTFSDEWIKIIQGSSDFFGLNHYTSVVVEPLVNTSILEWPNDQGLNYSYNQNWPSANSWLKIVPKGLGDILRTIKNKYNNPDVYITENGVSDGNGTNDNLRIEYLYSYMKEMLIAMKRDKCNVKAYTVWSFLDSFEWHYGYVDRFGLIDVDFNDKNRTRKYKKSTSWLKNVIRTRKLQTP